MHGCRRRLWAVAMFAFAVLAVPVFGQDDATSKKANEDRIDVMHRAAQLVAPIGHFEIAGRLSKIDHRDGSGFPAAMIVSDDLSGDGVADVVVSLVENVGGKDVQSVAAYTQSGKLIWKVNGPFTFESKNEREPLTPGGLRTVPDLNEDGVADIFVRDANPEPNFGVVSGKDGSVVGITGQHRRHHEFLAGVYDASKNGKPDLVFTTLPFKGKDKNPDRVGFSFVSIDSFTNIASMNHPLKRFDVRQRYLCGGLSISAESNSSEMLVWGTDHSSRTGEDTNYFALLDGKTFRTTRMTVTSLDLSKGDVFVSHSVSMGEGFLPSVLMSRTIDDGKNSIRSLSLVSLETGEESWSVPWNDPELIASIRSLTLDNKRENGHVDLQFGRIADVTINSSGVPIPCAAVIANDPVSEAGYCVLIVRKHDGNLVSVLRIPSEIGRMGPRGLPPEIDVVTQNENFSLLVTGETKNGKTAVFEFRLQ